MALSFAFLFFAPVFTFSQQTAEEPKKIQVEYSELGEFINLNGKETQKLKGSVRLLHDDVLVYCDSAVLSDNNAVLNGHVLFVQTDSSGAFSDSATYNGQTKLAKMYGDVVLEDGSQKLFTDVLEYDMDKKIATYKTGATISNGKSQISSQRGYYHKEEKLVFLKGKVLVADPDFTLRTDTMLYETETKTARFVAPTIITQPETQIYTESGFYNLETGVAEFYKNPQFVKENQKGRAKVMRYFENDKAFELFGDAVILEEGKETRADTILYNDETGKAFLIGNADYKDEKQSIQAPRIEYDSRTKLYKIQGRSRVSDPPNILIADDIEFNDELGNGSAQGNVVFTDTSNQTIIEADYMDYNKSTDFINAFGGAFGSDRPVMKSLIENDTLYLSADTLVSFRLDSVRSDSVFSSDTVRLLLAHRDVRIFKSDMQALCDSLSFSSQDSIFRLYSLEPALKPPVLWSDSTQFSGDTIRMQLKNQKLHRIWLLQNAWTINSEDNFFHNQIKGNTTTAYFQEGKVDNMITEGNAESIYYGLDENRKYIGVNEAKCSRMKIKFEEQQVQGIHFYAEPTGTFSPIKPSDAPKRLVGFRLFEERRPVLEQLTRKVDEPTSSSQIKPNDEQ